MNPDRAFENVWMNPVRILDDFDSNLRGSFIVDAKIDDSLKFGKILTG